MNSALGISRLSAVIAVLLLLPTSVTAESATGVPGHVKRDGKVDCGDLQIVKWAFGKQRGAAGFDAGTDVVAEWCPRCPSLSICRPAAITWHGLR